MKRSWRERVFGVERRDPEGYRCRVGAAWSRTLMPKGWAMVVNQTVWIRDPQTWRRYCRDTFWRAHEHHHFWQEREVFKGTMRYVAAFVWQYVRHRSHDEAPLEREADEAARLYVSTMKPRGEDDLA